MNNVIQILLLVLFVAGCATATRNNENNDKQPLDLLSGKNEITMNDTTPKVTGIGGIFFRSKNPKETMLIDKKEEEGGGKMY